MLPLNLDTLLAFRFANDRIIPCYHLEGVGVGCRVAGGRYQKGWVGTSKAPYKKWGGRSCTRGSAGRIRVREGRAATAVRLYGGMARSSLCFLGPEGRQLEKVLRLPSGGDTGDAGRVWHDGALWVSDHSSHEGKSPICFAEAKFGN